MKQNLHLYNTYTRRFEKFEPRNPNRVGIYLCGPTVYGPAHVGHARSAITADIMVRYLRHIGYDVCFVRNITDVGHLMGDGEDGEDKVGKKAKEAKVDPMEIAQRYVDAYHEDMRLLNVCAPSIEPRATGHMIEQISLIQTLLNKGYAYAHHGSVYFDLQAYNKDYPNYGTLSGRKAGDLRENTRSVVGKDEKKHPHDFALWKKATPNHLMAWASPWGKGFPGWHIECSAMSQKYLGTQFDMHIGGLDLCFPHHECEIAQGVAATGLMPARYWVHNNLVNVEKKKMSKSAGNFITLQACFGGTHPLLTQAYSPVVVRFFLLQTHYRHPIAFSDAALKAAGRGYYKLLNAQHMLNMLRTTHKEKTVVDNALSTNIERACRACYQAMDEDFNTSKVMAQLFALSKIINQLNTRQIAYGALTAQSRALLQETYPLFLQEILGLKQSHTIDLGSLMDSLIVQYKKAKQAKDYTTVDVIRNILKKQGVLIQDTPAGVRWSHTSTTFSLNFSIFALSTSL